MEKLTSPLEVGKVYIWEKHNGVFVPVYIKSGDYYSGNRICNFWYWHEIENGVVTNKIHSGYNNQGRFYKYNKAYILEIKIVDKEIIIPAFIIAQCPNCKTNFTVDGLFIGKLICCEHCGEIFNAWDNAQERRD